LELASIRESWVWVCTWKCGGAIWPERVLQEGDRDDFGEGFRCSEEFGGVRLCLFDFEAGGVGQVSERAL